MSTRRTNPKKNLPLFVSNHCHLSQPIGYHLWMEVRRCFPSIHVRFSVPSSSDLTPTAFEYLSSLQRLAEFVLTENYWRDVEVVEDRVN